MLIMTEYDTKIDGKNATGVFTKKDLHGEIGNVKIGQCSVN